MKFRYTPLFIASIGIIVFGLYYIFYKSDSNIGPLAGILVILLGALCLGFYFILRILFHAHGWLQLLLELTVIAAVLFFGFKLTRKVQLFIPPNYKGSILLVYGVDKAPRLKVTEFYHRNIHVMVPQSGIVMMSNTFAEKYINNLLIIDGLHRKAFEPGYNVGYHIDTLRCGAKTYIIEALNYTYPTFTNTHADTVDHDLKIEQVRKLLN